ncbi:hypothetical protein DF157_02470 [Burkholderia cenocepacia]|nr:hypothetical protein DF157_02470 [Burkholderia cenocepacia]RQU37693.1 hypothetical protein DF142_23195 [Burkholderia cenocepacia]RQU62267.1 hypothetical protein DF140_24800 [Burkholderia cenocepacia]RQV32112.1 hypothetical protein DF027_31565 [Burkholderia cenocepacia]RQV36075.1 hypothetical protein DF028_24925 [Burkholderia cenocepacia]
MTPRSLNAFSIVCCVDENAQRSRFRCRVKRDRLPHDVCGVADRREAGERKRVQNCSRPSP